MWARLITTNPFQFGLELSLTIAIAIMGFLIFIKTKEFAELSGKQSIDLFRYSFLFFSFSFLIRFFLFTFMATSFFLGFTREIRHLINVSLIPSILFFSFGAIMFLTSSLLKSLRNKHNIILKIVFISLVVSFLSLLSGSILVLFCIELIMIISSLVLIIVQNNKKKSKNHFLRIYFLLFLFWLFSIGTLIPNKAHVPVEIVIVPQIISTIIFIIIFTKVLKKTK